LEEDRGDNKEDKREDDEDDGEGEEGTGGRALALESFPDASRGGGGPVGLDRVLSGLANGEDGGGEEVVDLFANRDPSSTDRIGEGEEGAEGEEEKEVEDGDPLKD